VSALTLEQRGEICLAVEASYLDLRWSVGDHPDLLRSLERLARQMFLAGLASHSQPHLTIGSEKS
jgi:hypothetical protein